MTKELEKEYLKLLKYRGINDVEMPQNLFDIGSIIYSENIISNWYSFFFDTEEEHKLSNLFLNSLIELINENLRPEDEIEMDGCSVIREYSTGKGFIDLVIYDGDEEDFNSAIIIENKINASLNNDLNDYFTSIKVRDKKVGIVLSLNEIKVDDNNFQNITHYKLSKRVKENLSSFLLKASDKHLLYLKDFLETIEYISKPLEMDEDIKFYIKNIEKINKLIEIKDKAEQYIVDSISREITKSDYLQWSRKNKDSITLSVIDSNLRVYIFYTDIFEAGDFEISLWLNSKDDVLKFEKNFKKELEDNFKNISFEWEKQGDKWLFICSKNYSELSEKDFSKIGKIIANKIEQDFSKLISHLKSKI